MANEDAGSKTCAASSRIRGGYYVVCLIDVQGQEAKLAKWAQPPSSMQPTPEFMMAVEQTAGTVLHFKKMFEDYFRLFDISSVPDIIDSLPEEKRNLYRRAIECHLSTQQFSDTFVFYAPILNTNDDRSISPLYRILTACCMAMTESLANSIPLRGAVHIGMGLELAERTFYGPALAEVHHLESKIADYPRIIVSDQAVKFAQSSSGFSQDDNINTAMRGIAGICCQLLCNDVDKQMIVDFLGKGACTLRGGANHVMIDYVEKSYRFVRAEALRFQQEADETLAPRYAKLQKYMEAHLPIWGLERLLG